MVEVINGREIASRIRRDLAGEVESLSKAGVVPALAVVVVGEDPASKIYVRNKARACEEVGIDSIVHRLSQETTEEELLDLIGRLNANPSVHAVLVQLPLPDHIDAAVVIEAVTPHKDVDGFHPYNMGRLLTGAPTFCACTPLGIMKLIESTGIALEGKDAVVVGRSNIVGKPVALLLLAENATVTLCHSRTVDLKAKVGSADVVVAAVGSAGLVRGDWIKPGAVVIDVGMNRAEDGKLVGDVEFEAASKRASYITPVPGGVGPMTIAMLLTNTVKAAKADMGRRNL